MVGFLENIFSMLTLDDPISYANMTFVVNF